MSGVRILSGLPPYGPPPEPFSATGQGTHSQGLVVEFTPQGGARWAGNFQRGLSRFDAVEAQGALVLVVAGGQGYVIDVASRRCTWTFGAMINAVLRASSGQLVFADGLGLFSFVGGRALWRTRRISLDGFEQLALTGDRVTGLALRSAGDEWVPFTVELATGAVSGGGDFGD